MKIRVEDLKPNPFRKIDKYPINKEKVEGLKTSINETTFWDNILARKNNGSIEIAYGHHRLIALNELGIEEVDIPIRDLDDSQMIRIMANENLDEWKATPGIYTETVLVTKEYLDSELSKYDTWDHANKNIKMLFKSNSQFQNCKKNGVGQTTILNFLGGNWKQWIIQDALNTIKCIEEKTISKNAINELSTPEHAKVFKTKVKKYNISLKEQDRLANEIKEESVKGHEVADAIEQHAYAKMTEKNKKVKKDKKTPDISSFVVSVEGEMQKLTAKGKSLLGHAKGIERDTAKTILIGGTKRLLKTYMKLFVELTGVDELTKLFKEIKEKPLHS